MDERSTEHSSVDARGIRPPDAYEIEARVPADGVLVLDLEGEFDLAAVPAMREQLDAALAADERAVVLDFTDVTFVDSSGLRELLRAAAAFAAEDKAFALAALRPTVVRLFELTGASDAIRTAPTVERALTMLAERS